MEPHARTTQALWEDVDEARHLLENGAAGAHGGLSGQSHLSAPRDADALRRHGTRHISSFRAPPGVRVTAGRPPLLIQVPEREEPLAAALNNSWGAPGCAIWPLLTLTFPGGCLQIHEGTAALISTYPRTKTSSRRAEKSRF